MISSYTARSGGILPRCRSFSAARRGVCWLCRPHSAPSPMPQTEFQSCSRMSSCRRRRDTPPPRQNVCSFTTAPPARTISSAVALQMPPVSLEIDASRRWWGHRHRKPSPPEDAARRRVHLRRRRQDRRHCWRISCQLASATEIGTTLDTAIGASGAHRASRHWSPRPSIMTLMTAARFHDDAR